MEFMLVFCLNLILLKYVSDFECHYLIQNQENKINKELIFIKLLI